MREQLAYERHLSIYPPSDRDRRYYSKWLQFVSPHATRPTYISPDSPQKMLQNMQNQAVSTGVIKTTELWTYNYDLYNKLLTGRRNSLQM